MEDVPLGVNRALPGAEASAPAGMPDRKKQAVRRLIVAFLLVMIALTLFSQTLLQFTLPQVDLEQPGPGALSHYVSGSGTIEAAAVVDYYTLADTHWPARQMKVKVGDQVKAGETLVTFDTAAGEAELEDEQARYRQQQIGLEQLQDEYIAAQQSGDEAQIRSMDRNIEIANLNLQIQARKLDQLRQQLQDGASIKSAVTGIVLAVNASPGAPVTGSGPVVSVSDSSKPLQISAVIPDEQAKFVAAGDEFDVTVNSLDGVVLKGKLTAIRNPGTAEQGGQGQEQMMPDGKELVIDLQDDRLKGGEAAAFSISKQTSPAKVLVSNSAVRENQDGHYVLVLKQSKGVLGDEYYAQQVKVITGDSDDTNTVISGGLTAMDKVIASATKPVADGNRVRLAD